NTVVVKLLGRPMGYKFLCNRLESLWTITKGFKVIDLENGFFLDRFRSEDDVDCALTQGPWTVLGHYFIIQQWTLYLDSTSEKIDSMVAWIRLPSMPLHYYKKKKYSEWEDTKYKDPNLPPSRNISTSSRFGPFFGF
ncbi:hypothetical protein CISIN_1g039478mg, partial [Citrus sinensis]